MVPNASELARRRLTAATIVRLVGLLPVFAIMIAWAGFISGNLAEPLDEAEPWIVMTALAVFAGVITAGIFALAPWVSTKLVPTPRDTRCPACRYVLEGLVEPRCPECGIALTREFMGEPPEPDDGIRPRPSEVNGRVATFTPIVRILGFMVTIPFGVAAAVMLSLAFVAHWNASGDWENGHRITFTILSSGFGVATLVGLTLLFFGGRVAWAIVPRAKRPDRPPEALTAGESAPAVDEGAPGAVRLASE